MERKRRKEEIKKERMEEEVKKHKRNILYNLDSQRMAFLVSSLVQLVY